MKKRLARKKDNEFVSKTDTDGSYTGTTDYNENSQPVQDVDDL